MEVNFGSQGLSGSATTFGGQCNPYCNFTSPLAKKFVYKEKNPIHYPLRRHIFRMKVRTAAEIRFFDLIRNYMEEKLSHKKLIYCAATTAHDQMDHHGTIIPKDEYEIKKFTSYMMSKKASTDYKNFINERWQKAFFMCTAHNHVGKGSSIHRQNARPATEEEYMVFIWFVVLGCAAFAFFFTLIWWWRKYGQGYEYVQIN